MHVESWTIKKAKCQELMLSNCSTGEDSWEPLGKQGDQTSQSSGKSALNTHWKDWCWSSNTLATWCEELTHWKRPWCWERLRAGGETGDRGWDGWMASPTQWTWVWVGSGSWWWTGRPGMLWLMGSQRARHDSTTTTLVVTSYIAWSRVNMRGTSKGVDPWRYVNWGHWYVHSILGSHSHSFQNGQIEMQKRG